MPDPDIDKSEYWEGRYAAAQSGWDLRTPTPVFTAWFQRTHIPPGKMLVPGCGTGHDAIYFAQQGFDVTAVDFAAHAVAATEENARLAGVSLTALVEDIFNLADRFPEALESFDYVLEYTCFCAISPERRAEWINVVHSVLKPNGPLIGLFFPIDGREGGPPFAVSIEEVTALLEHDFTLIESTNPAESVSPRRGKEILMVWKKNMR